VVVVSLPSSAFVVTIAWTTALGTTVPELGIDKLGALHVGTWPKKKFSMDIPKD